MIAIQPSVKKDVVFNLEGKEFNTLKEYRQDAVRIIKNAYNGATRLVDDEEAISVVICALVEADYTWDSNKGASKRTHRFNKTRYALGNYLRQRSSSARRSESLDGDELPDSSTSPVKRCIDNECLEAAQQFFANLTPRKREMVDMKSRGMSYTDIADYLGTSRQYVQQTIMKIKGDFFEFREQRSSR